MALDVDVALDVPREVSKFVVVAKAVLNTEVVVLEVPRVVFVLLDVPSDVSKFVVVAKTVLNVVVVAKFVVLDVVVLLVVV